MTTTQSIQEHLDALVNAPILKKDGHPLNFFNQLMNRNFQILFPFFVGILTGILGFVGGMEFLVGNPSPVISTIAGIGALSLVSFWKLSRYSARILPAQVEQWNEMVKRSEEILILNPQHANVINKVVGMIDDGRASYQWADKMSLLLMKLHREEIQLKNRKDALVRIEVLAKTHQPTQNTVEDLVEVEPIRPTSQQINL